MASTHNYKERVNVCKPSTASLCCRYAAQISKKLSCFWGLVPLGRPGASLIRGITNALDPRDSLAAAGMSLDAVLALKASCKVQLQQLYGLAPGQQYSLATFVGRMTQQKGCDVIAEAAQALMTRYPLLQLVVVGPAGERAWLNHTNSELFMPFIFMFARLACCVVCPCCLCVCLDCHVLLCGLQLWSLIVG